MRTALVGVVGHVDHGKTSLVKALTGIDTDRLKEEKERGISIALGFAHLVVPGGEIDLVDMPGHERFVRTMIAGATGIDSVLLIVAANEGVKPQTVEHVEIARLLGIGRAVVAVTKCDLAAPEDAQRAAAAAHRLLAAGGFADAPVVFTSAATGTGIAELARRLAELPASEEREDHGFFYLPVDRVFAAAGFGTVVTGTLRRGPIRVGDEVEIAPGGRRARVRSLQVHGKPVESVAPGRRAAVNLRGIERADLSRGLALATPGTLAPSRWLDAEITLLGTAPRPLDARRELRLLFGATEVAARVRLLDRDELQPGASAVVQLRCEEDVALPAREPFVLRVASPALTIGGGTILDPGARRRRRFDEAALAELRSLALMAPAAAIETRLAAAGHRGRRVAELARLVGFAPQRVRVWAKELRAEIFGDGTVLHPDAYHGLQYRLLAHLDAFHRANPDERGMSRERLRAALPDDAPASAAAEIVARLVDLGHVVPDRGLLRRKDFVPPPEVPGRDAGLIDEIAEAFRRGGLMPPDIGAVLGRDLHRHRAARELIRRGILARAVDRVQQREILFHEDAIALARSRLADGFPGEAEFLVGDAGKLLGISRKYSVPLLEHLDALHVTRRDGDRRVVIRRRAETGREKNAVASDAPTRT